APDRLPSTPSHVAVVGAGIAGLACARTLVQAGLRVTVFESGNDVGGRTCSVESPFGTFDAGAQYFTVRDARFEQALATAPGAVKRWSANAVRVLDPHGRVVEAALPARESHWVGTPGMDELARQWARPLRDAGQVELQTRVTRIERDALAPTRWQLQTAGPQDAVHVFSGFDAVLLAIPAAQAGGLLAASPSLGGLAEPLAAVDVAPCWTLMVAYPQAVQPTLPHLGPQWNAALSTHHRVAWLARESSKPGRGPVERWTVQASADWSREHLMDDGHRVLAKLLKAFGEVTGILAEPSHAEVMRWRWAKTMAPLGQSHLWHPRERIGLCGDWCTGHRVEDAFLSGLALALDLIAHG
ncbi:NAD(P)/FAD-dependent oxidoreductase, partial [Ramlibacter aquaticus]|uniref:NAD(P)/FAD-dependent oxidoreductase n=1 Tax=Ramlibacter aquaticus TaxID=2780094 RepID=UPI001D113440